MIGRKERADVTLWRRWADHATTTPDREAIVHWVAGEEPFRWSYASLLAAAETQAVRLVQHNVKRGEVCAIIVKHNRHLYPLYLSCVAIGAIPTILAYPNPRLHPQKFREGLEGMARRSGLDWILTERDLEPVLRPLVEARGSTIRGVHLPFEWDRDLSPLQNTSVHSSQAAVSPADPLLLQHSSGTTGLQKPVLLSHQSVLRHIENYSSILSITSHDKVASWLPLYHDMGLIAAFHLPLACGITSVHIDPFEWVVMPSLLLEVVSSERATISWLPNFAHALMATKIRDDELEGIDLASWRLVINCSEPIRHEDRQRFIERFGRRGLNRNALSTCYAMAETTFAVTQTVPGYEPAVLALDRNGLAEGRVVSATRSADARFCVSSGPAISECEVRVVGDDSCDVASGHLGEFVVRSTSMFDGYRHYPEKTAEVVRDGWYYTGDYGFCRDGECYVIGRKKDVIIIAGTNIYPEDVEAAVGTVEGVIPGRVVALGEEDEEFGSERLVVMAETACVDEHAQRALRQAIILAGMSLDVTINTVYLVPPRYLIKSSAGKPSRSANRSRIPSLKAGLDQMRASVTTTNDY